MSKNLVIIESPNKKTKIEKYLKQSNLSGTYSVIATVGHVLNLEKSGDAVDTKNNYNPVWKVMKDKASIVKDIRSKVRGADHVYIATDPDLAGEFIGWSVIHFCGLKNNEYNRVTFNAITLDTIVNGFMHTLETDRKINMNKVYAEQTRRILDRLIGFGLSPLVIKVVGGKSAGRCQSPITKLIYERDKNIDAFEPSSKFSVNGVFVHNNTNISTTLNKTFRNEDGVEKFFDILKNTKEFSITSVKKTTHQKKPSLPYKTSTLLSDVSSKTGWSVKTITSGLQALFTQGLITYIRTKSTKIDASAISVIEHSIGDTFDKNDIDPSKRKILSMVVSDDKKVKGKSEQEGHECIRVTNPSLMMDVTEFRNDQHRKLYVWIWKRTLASIMKPQEYDKYTMTIHIKKVKTHYFTGSVECVTYNGFMKVYTEYDTFGHKIFSKKDAVASSNHLIPLFKKLMKSEETNAVEYAEITASETLSSPPSSFSEASLITEMESLHIGTEATYPSIVSTIVERKYVEAYSDAGTDFPVCKYVLTSGDVVRTVEKKRMGVVKNKLRTTTLGKNVVEYLCQDFGEIMDYDYTSKLEQEIIKVERGEVNWYDVVHSFYMRFKPIVDDTNQKHKEDPNHHKRLLGEHNELRVFAYRAKYGPVVQLGDKKPSYTKIPTGKQWDKISLVHAIELIESSVHADKTRNDGKEIVIYNGEKYYSEVRDGKWGPYIMLSLVEPKTSVKLKPKPITIGIKEHMKELNITSSDTIHSQMVQKIIKISEIQKKKTTFEEYDGFSVEIKAGRYDRPYIQLTSTSTTTKRKTKPVFISIPKTIDSSNITQNQVTELIIKKLKKLK